MYGDQFGLTTQFEFRHADTAPLVRRIDGFDVARALAILGMVVVHFSLVMASDRSGPAWMNVVLGFLDGRAAATFVVLAGIGITLMSQRAVASHDREAIANIRRVLVRRGICLLVIGFINLAIWPGDILRVYGVSLLLNARLITASGRRLLVGAFGYALGFLALVLVLDFDQQWDWSTLTYHDLWTPAGLVRNLFYDGFRSVFPWTGFMLFGMWLGRLNLREPKTNRRVLIVAAATAVVTEIVSWLCVSYLLAHPNGIDADTIKALFGTDSMPALPLFLLASGSTAAALIALCVRVVETYPSSAWWPLIATGQMALTWYFFHIVFGLGTVVALDLAGSWSLPEAAGCGVAFFAVAVVVSCLWKAKFRHGPLEWAMRRIAGQPLR
jgi:uncharacterized protein